MTMRLAPGRATRLMALASGTALVLTACGGDDGESAEGDGSSSSESGSGGEGGPDGEPFLVGIYGPGVLPQGTSINNAAQLAVDQLNADNGVGGRPIELTEFCDTQDGAQPQLAQQCVQGFIQEDRVDAIIGGFSSAEVIAAVEPAVDGETLFINVGAASPAVNEGVTTDNERRFVFSIGPVDSLALAGDMCLTYVAKLFPQLGVSRVGILFEDVEYNQQLIPALSQCLTDPAGSAIGQALQLPDSIPAVELVATEGHAPDATDFSSQFSALESAGAEFVIASNSRQEGVTIVQQWAETKPSFGLSGINVAGQAPGFFQAVGGGDARYFLNGPAGTIRAPVTEQTIEFYDAFESEFGEGPVYTGAPTYDAFQMLALAAEEAGGADDPDALITALAGLEYEGAQGMEMFDETHRVVYGAGGLRPGVNPLYFQFGEDGAPALVFPETIDAAQAYAPPPWVQFAGPIAAAEGDGSGVAPEEAPPADGEEGGEG